MRRIFLELLEREFDGLFKLRVVPFAPGVRVEIDAPYFAVYLLPFGARIDPDLHVAELQFSLAWLCGLGRACYEPIVALLIEELLSVERDIQVLDTGNERLDLALGQIEFGDHQHGRTLRIGIGRLIGENQSTCLAGEHGDVVFRRDGKRQDSLADVFKINGHFHRFFGRFLALVLIARVLRIFFFLSRSGFVLCGGVLLIFIRNFFLVAFRGERRREILAQHDHIHAARDVQDIAGHIEPAGGGPDIRAGGEIQVFAVLVEDGEFGVARSVGNLRGLARRERVNEDGTEMVLEEPGVSDPLAIGRLGRIQIALRRLVRIRIDFYGRGLVEVEVPNVQPLVRIGNFLAVRRPFRLVEKRRRVAQRNFPRFAKSALILQVQSIFAAFVREIRDPFSVRGIVRMAFDARSGCEANGFAAVSTDFPEIIAVDESNVRFIQCGLAEQEVRSLLRETRKCE